MKVLITSIGVPGHLNPMLAAASILARHHEVAVQTSGELQGMVDAAQLRFISERPNSRSFAGHLIADNPLGMKMSDPVERHAYEIEHFFADTIPIQAKNLTKALDEFSADIIIGDSHYFGTLPMLLGPQSSRPAIAALGVSVLDVHSGRHAPRGTSGQTAEESERDAQYRRMLLEPVQLAFDRSLQKCGCAPLPCPALASLSNLSDLYLHPGVESFEYPQRASKVRFIGRPPMAKGQASLPAWWEGLDSRKRLVLVTQGTIANRDLNQLIGPVLSGLAAEQDIIVLVTTGGTTTENLQTPIPSNARIAEFLPYEQIFPKLDALVTNGGYGTVSMALAHGVPIVAAGMTEDKEEVSEHVQWAQVGLNLHTDTPSPEAIRESVREVLGKDLYRVNAQKIASEYKRFDVEDTLLREIEACVSRHQPLSA